jgi:hypothetical protein
MLLALLVSSCALQAETPRQDYDLTVIVMGISPELTQVVASYSHPVDHAALRAGIAAFARSSRFAVSGEIIREAPLFHGSKEQSSGVEFAAPGLMQSGRLLPVAALMGAFPDWRYARLVFLTGTGFRFAGPESNAGAVLTRGAASYEYDVEKVTAGTASALSPQRDAPTRKARSPRGGINVLLAFATLAVIWIVFRLRRRGK